MVTTGLNLINEGELQATLQIDLRYVPMGANLIAGGATFRTWAPRAKQVHVMGEFNQWKRSDQSQLQSIGNGHWACFIPNIRSNQEYLFYIEGIGGNGYKRDPYARDLTFEPPFPNCNCLIQNPGKFPWHDQNFSPPRFNDLIIYQFHVGTFWIKNNVGKFLDVIDRLDYLVALGINAIQPLPIVEFPTEFSLGYNGTDYYSPESDYAISDPNQLQSYLNRLNELLVAKHLPPYEMADIATSSNQLRALIDLCHVYGIAVLLDVVYNHAGGGFDLNSIYFYDKLPYGNNNDSLFFTDQGWAGGLIFAYWNQEVSQFLINNAAFFIKEFHADGFRHDEVSVIDRYGGWHFCQNLTDTCHYIKPSAIQIAEYWPVNSYVLKPTPEGGAGFDASWNDLLRDNLRQAISQAAGGADRFVNMDGIADAIRTPGFSDSWRAIQYIESHDEVKAGERVRIPKLADPSNSHSWYARSRSRFAMGVLLTAPGIPMLFMGQEFLEDKQWSDTPSSSTLLWWQGVNQGDKPMVDFLRFTQELIHLRRNYAALRGASTNVFHIHNANRILAFHRWIEGIGQDIIVIASLNEFAYYNYQLGFPLSGRWNEIFNSHVYDNWVNPYSIGNGGGIEANGPGMHGLPFSSSIVIPPNGILIFAK